MGRPASCNCGECFKCRRAAYMREWYRRPGNAEAQRQSQKESRLRRIEEVRAYDRARGFRVYDEEKVAARRAVKVAVLAGLLVRQPCEVCGDPQTDGHHEDYGRPLDVRWLCRPHHLALHRKVA